MPRPLVGEQADSGQVSYPRAARWEPETVLAELAAATGIRLVNEGRCRGGQIGACYVRWPDGHRSVLTAGPPGSSEAQRAADMTAVARAAGVPAPRYELVADLSGGTAVVQELLPGTVPVTVTRRTVASIVEVTRRCRGLLADRTDLPAPSLFLRTDGPGFCLHGAMASYDRRTAGLLAVIEEAGAELPEHLAGGDLVHFDLHPENVLVTTTGEVTGVVDWDGAGRGDGALDLMTLRFDLARRAPGLGDWVGGLLRESVPEPVRLACWAHMSLRLVDWAIREQTADDVGAWLKVATDLMQEYGPIT
jgi:aminoglycoside phosphotransferase (APT) family kinase protein